MFAPFTLALALTHSLAAFAQEPPSDIVGRLRHHVVTEGETLIDIAPENDLGILSLMVANPGIDPWIPPPGTVLTLPTAHILPQAERAGIVVNLAELRLYYFPSEGGSAYTTPIGMGREGYETPLGSTKVVRKVKGPTWFPTATTRADRPELPASVPPGPNNPLGDYALYLGWPTYVIHGTNKPNGVGRRVSRGCMRLYPTSIEYLFGTVAVGTPVAVIYQPAKFGWHEGELFAEIHPDLWQYDELAAKDRFSQQRTDYTDQQVLALVGNDAGRIDWYALKRAETERTGIPTQITNPSGIPVTLFDDDGRTE